MIEWDELSNNDIKKEKIILEKKYNDIKEQLLLKTNKLDNIKKSIEQECLKCLNELKELDIEYNQANKVLTKRGIKIT